MHSSRRLPAHIYNAWRFSLVTVLWSMGYLELAPRFFGSYLPLVFQATLTLYWIAALVILYLETLFKQPRPIFQGGSLLLDILAWLTLLYASGGVTTGFGLVLVIVCASAALLLSPRGALSLACITILGLFIEELSLQYLFPTRFTAFSQLAGHAVVILVLTSVVAWLAFRIRESEARQLDWVSVNEKIITLLDIGVMVVDSTMSVLQANKAAQRLLGYQLQEDCLPVLPETLKASIASRSSHVPERPYQLQFVPLKTHLLVLLHDPILQNRQARQGRLAALGQMASNVAHEIRNPLSAIVQANQHLQSDANEIEHFTSIIARQCARMNRTIETVLSLSRQPTCHLRHFTVEECLEGTYVEGRLKVDQQNTAIEIYADRLRLEQVFTILLENAAQFSNKISITALAEPEGVLIQVEDDGPGIPDKDLPYVFDPFFSTRSEGTGLGLYLAHHLCKAMHIELYYVNSDRGARFDLWVPHFQGDPT